MKVRFHILLAVALAVSACEPTVLPATGLSVVRASPTAGPGPNPITVSRARDVFTALCVTKKGSPSGTEAAASQDGFVKNTTFGTYYHPRDNLSVKLIEGDCSMVFASLAPEAQLRSALTSVKAGAPIRWRGGRPYGGVVLYNVRIAAQ